MRYAALVTTALPRLFVVLVTAVSVACTTTTTVSVPAGTAGRVLAVDDKTYDVPADGRVRVEVGPGFQPVPVEVRASAAADAPVLVTGSLVRSEPVVAVAAAAAAGALCCVPSLVATGMCLANPALLAAPLLCLARPEAALGICVPVLQAPSCLTVPFATTGATLGLSPLLLGLVAQAPPADVVLEQAPPASPRVAQGGMSW